MKPSILGTLAEEACVQIEVMLEAGLGEVALRLHAEPEAEAGLELIGTRVIPALG
jgi:hypothetical protein